MRLLVERTCEFSARKARHIIELKGYLSTELVQLAVRAYREVGWKVCVPWRGVRATPKHFDAVFCPGSNPSGGDSVRGHPEPSHRARFQEPSFIYANEDIVREPTKAKNGDIGVVTGRKDLQGRQFDLRLQSREKAHDVMLIGWSCTEKLTHDPPARHAQKRARQDGESEHRSSSASAGASDHGVEPPTIPVNPVDDRHVFPEHEVDFGVSEEEDAIEEKQVEEIWMTSHMFRMVSHLLPAFADTEDNKKASSTESNVMPNDFAARILECEVVIPDVLDVMSGAVNKLLTTCVIASRTSRMTTSHSRMRATKSLGITLLAIEDAFLLSSVSAKAGNTCDTIHNICDAIQISSACFSSSAGFSSSAFLSTSCSGKLSTTCSEAPAVALELLCSEAPS